MNFLCRVLGHQEAIEPLKPRDEVTATAYVCRRCKCIIRIEINNPGPPPYYPVDWAQTK